MIHTPGKKQMAADALSRRKNSMPSALYRVSVCINEASENEDVETDELVLIHMKLDEIRARVGSVIGNTRVEVISWDRLSAAAHEDLVMAKLVEQIYRGFPDSSRDLDPDLRTYHRFRHDLHVIDGVACYKDRIIIPESLR